MVLLTLSVVNGTNVDLDCSIINWIGLAERELP